jgi:hypothetical protein
MAVETVMGIDVPLFGVLVGAFSAVSLNYSNHANPHQPPRQAKWPLAGCGKSRDFGKTVMKRARNGNPGLIKSTGYEGAKGDELGWKHHRPTFSAAC